MSEDVEIQLPVDFVVHGTPVSAQTKVPTSRDRWKELVRDASFSAVAADKYLLTERLAVTIYDFPTDESEGDVDNIVKFILDALKSRIWCDDKQVKRVVVQRFLSEELYELSALPELIERAWVHDPPFVFVHVSGCPMEQAQ